MAGNPGTSFGRVMAWNDFTAIPPISAADTVPLAQGSLLGGGWSLHGVNEGTVTSLATESGGILACVSDTGDNDNIAVSSGVYSPADGGIEMEFRVKIPDSLATTRAACWVGLTETLAVDTPVMPAETATTTTTYNGTGAMAGFVFDSDSTALIWRFVAGDAGAALATKDSAGTAGTALGIDAEATITIDKWWVFRVEVTPDGIARGYILDAAGANNSDTSLRLVGESTVSIGATNMFHATTIGENRSGANETFKLDYSYASSRRNWDA